MNRAKFLIPFVLLAAIGLPQEGEEGHMHGPDGRHIVTEQAAQGASSFILSHHDMRVEGPDGKSIEGVVVNSTISPKGKPGAPIHTEKNVYEPENEVYGSHLTYTEPGEYVLSQDVAMPDGRKIQVEFPIYVPAAPAASAAPGAVGGGPNLPLMVGGVVAGILLLFGAYRLGRRSAAIGVPGLMVLVLLSGLMPVRAWAGGEEDGHVHGPDGRHIVTEKDAVQAAGPQLRAFVGPNRELSTERTVDGIRFVLTIENEEMRPDPDLISVTKQQMDLIGLKTASSVATGSANGLEATGRVSANPNGVVKVNTRSAGRVLRLGALPGATVQRGQMLAVIESPPLADAQSAYRSATQELSQSRAGVQVAEASVAAAKTEVEVAKRTLDRESELARAGEFTSPALERAKSEVSTLRSQLETSTAEVSRLERLVSRLRSGIESGVVAQRDLERAESELTEATAAKTDDTNQLRIAQESLAREEIIARRGLRNARAIDQARAQYDLARSSLNSAASRLIQARADVSRVQSMIRLAADQVRLLGGSVGGGNTITITSPIAAVVETRMVSVGQTVAAGEPLYDLLNADIVWVLADVFESDVPRVRIGQAMSIAADAYPDAVYEGEVAFVSNEVNPQTRTTQVRIVLDNPGGRLKQNMFVRVNLRLGGDAATAVPTAAIQSDRGLDVVFVEEKAGVFRRTVVQVKRAFGGQTVVEGLAPGRKVVTGGSYQLLAMGGPR